MYHIFLRYSKLKYSPPLTLVLNSNLRNQIFYKGLRLTTRYLWSRTKHFVLISSRSSPSLPLMTRTIHQQEYLIYHVRNHSLPTCDEITPESPAPCFSVITATFSMSRPTLMTCNNTLCSKSQWTWCSASLCVEVIRQQMEVSGQSHCHS